MKNTFSKIICLFLTMCMLSSLWSATSFPGSAVSYTAKAEGITLTLKDADYFTTSYVTIEGDTKLLFNVPDCDGEVKYTHNDTEITPQALTGISVSNVVALPAVEGVNRYTAQLWSGSSMIAESSPVYVYGITTTMIEGKSLANFTKGSYAIDTTIKSYLDPATNANADQIALAEKLYSVTYNSNNTYGTLPTIRYSDRTANVGGYGYYNSSDVTSISEENRKIVFKGKIFVNSDRNAADADNSTGLVSYFYRSGDSNTASRMYIDPTTNKLLFTDASTTKLDSGISLATNQWHSYKAEIDVDARTVDYYMDGILVRKGSMISDSDLLVTNLFFYSPYKDPSIFYEEYLKYSSQITVDKKPALTVTASSEDKNTVTVTGVDFDHFTPYIESGEFKINLFLTRNGQSTEEKLSTEVVLGSPTVIEYPYSAEDATIVAKLVDNDGYIVNGLSPMVSNEVIMDITPPEKATAEFSNNGLNVSVSIKKDAVTSDYYEDTSVVAVNAAGEIAIKKVDFSVEPAVVEFSSYEFTTDYSPIVKVFMWDLSALHPLYLPFTYEPDRWTVTFDYPQGMSSSQKADVILPATTTHINNTPLSSIEEPDVGKHCFLGWYYDAELTQPVGDDALTKDTLLYPSIEFVTESHTISFAYPTGMSDEEKALITLPQSRQYSDGTLISSIDDPEVGTNIFLGWYYDAELTNAVSSVDELTDNITLYPYVIFELKENRALTAVAESYLLRGSSVQYDDSDITEDGLARAEYGVYSPEQYTTQSVGYTNEMAFCHDVYKEALDITLPTKSADELLDQTDMVVMTRNITGSETSEDAVSVSTELKNTLQPGDIIVFKSNASSKAHTLIYIGDEKVIHSVGESYNVSSGTDTAEANGALEKVDLDNFFNGSNPYYAFNYSKLGIVRPLNVHTAVTIPEKSVLRLKNMQGIVAEKTASHGKGVTVHPGEEITFTFSVKNTNSYDVTVEISDKIPENTTYIDGCDDYKNNYVEWNLTVPAGETETVSYTVKVDDNTALCEEGYILSENSTVGGIEVNCHKIYVGLSLNKVDQKRMRTAIQSLYNSNFEGTTLTRWMYQTAFTKNVAIGGTAADVLKQIYVDGGEGSTSGAVTGEEISGIEANLCDIIAPTLYGGRSIPASTELKGSRSKHPSKADLITGDILFTQKTLDSGDDGICYIYNGKEFVELLKQQVMKHDADELLTSVLLHARFAVLRPSMAMTTLNHYQEETDEELTLAQQIVINAAESYLLRGDRIQYDDKGISSASASEQRWQYKVKPIEEYTTAERGYVNCAVFTFESYYQGLGYNTIYYSTSQLKDLTESQGMVYTYEKTGSETDSEKAAIEKEILETLQPGDIVVVRRISGYAPGHAMLYIGNGTIIHSTGSSYNYTDMAETYETTIRYRSVMDLFSEGETCDIFSIVKSFHIIRPLKKYTGTPSKNVVNRLNNLKGIVAEKISSHTSSMNVSPGDEMTFTFFVQNTNDEAVTLDIKDTVPQNTTYISGADTVDGDKLSWKITVPADERVSVSYKVKVNSDVAVTGEKYVYSSESYVADVYVRCPEVYIKNTLDAQDTEKLLGAIDDLSSSSLSGLPLANEIYSKAFNVSNIFSTNSYDDITTDLFVESTTKSGYYELNTSGSYYSMIPSSGYCAATSYASSLYGGRKVYTKAFNNTRTRFIRPHNLMAGDIILAESSTAKDLYIYDGTDLLNLNNSFAKEDMESVLEKLLGAEYYFAVLRPANIMN